MTTLATVLKDEIRRLARKEARAQTDKLQTASAQYRRDIAALKRQVAALERKLVLLEKTAWGSGRAASGGDVAVENVRFSAKGLVSQRARLGLSAADYAALVGVTAQTLYNWEHGRTRPREDQLKALVGVRGISKREALARLEQLA